MNNLGVSFYFIVEGCALAGWGFVFSPGRS
jgi:hypothetical protein